MPKPPAAGPEPRPGQPDENLRRQIHACCEALADKKAERVQVLHLGPEHNLADFFILVTGNSQPHLRAMRIAVEHALDQLGAPVFGVESDSASGWVVVDAYDFLVHLQTSEMRSHYALDLLWRDADDVTAQYVTAPDAPTR